MNIHQVTTLPGTLQADAVYLVLNGNYCETYVTDNSSVAKLVGNSTMIDQRIAALTSSLSGFEIVANIAARDALSPTANKLAFVTDASADSTVASGAAMYAYDLANTAWIKATEFESFNENVVLNWSAIQGGPSSTPAAIDSAVTNSHAHANKTQLDLIAGTATKPTYNGQPVATLETNNW